MGNESNDKKRTGQMPTRVGGEDRIEGKIDRDLEDSFPAGDPPGWTLGVRRRGAGKEEEDADGSSPAVTGDTT